MPLSLLQQLPWPTVEQASSHHPNPFSLHPSSHFVQWCDLLSQCSPPAKRHSRRHLTLSIPPSPHSPTLVLTTTVSYLRTFSDVSQHCSPAVRLFYSLSLSLSLSPCSHTLLDPTAEEERVCTGQVTVVTLSTGKLSTVCKTGTLNSLSNTLNGFTDPILPHTHPHTHIR